MELSPDAVDAKLRVDAQRATLLIYGGAVVSAHTGNFSPNRIMIAKRESKRLLTPIAEVEVFAEAEAEDSVCQRSAGPKSC